MGRGTALALPLGMRTAPLAPSSNVETSIVTLVVDADPARGRALAAALPGVAAVVHVAEVERAIAAAREVGPALVCVQRDLASALFLRRLRDEACRRARIVAYGAAELPAQIDQIDEVVAGPPVDQLGRGRLARLVELAVLEQRVEREELAIHELSRAQDDLTRLLVHDLNGPLGVLLTNLEMARETDGLPEAAAPLVADSITATLRLSRVVRGIAELKRLEERRAEPRALDVGLLATVETMLAPSRDTFARRGIALDVAIPADARVAADLDLLRSVLGNLVDNALRHTPRGGRFRAWTSADDPNTLRVGNSGPPVPLAGRGSIFEKYGQTAETGRAHLGLGLYYCRLAMERIGGRLWYEESAELPAVFALRFPAAIRRSAAAAA